MNFASVLNIIFLIIAATLIWRFLRTGGPAMLRMMDQPMAMSGEMDAKERGAPPVSGMGTEE